MTLLDTAEVAARPTWTRVFRFREFMLLAIILVGAAALGLAAPESLSAGSLLANLITLVPEAIVGVGMTVLLVSGGFDLSVGSTVGLAGAVTAWGLVHGLPVPVAILAGLALGAGIGALNGTIIAGLGINPFVTTLAMMGIGRGALQVMISKATITSLPASFNRLGQGTLWGVQYPILLALALVLAGDLLMRKHRFFRQSYYIGGNPRAARLSGIAVDRVTILNYMLTGLLAAVAGIAATARLGSATASAAKGLELKVITAVIIGGASLSGGEGTVLGSFLGTLLMTLLVSAQTQLGIPPEWSDLVVGVTLLAAVIVDRVGKRRQR